MKEFRVVIKDISSLNPDASTGKDFNDYYLHRGKRIRNILKENEWFIIDSEPGIIVKNLEKISEKQGKEMMKEAMLIVKKKGYGRLIVADIEGYVEKVSAYHINEDAPFLEETQIEFETDFDKIPVIKEALNVEKIIEVGLFDYLNE